MQPGGVRYITYPSRKDRITIWNLADLHVGSGACAENDLRRDIARIAEDPNAFWLGGGDYAEFISRSDKRFDPDCVAEWVKVKDLGKLGMVHMQRVRDLLYPIREKCLGLLLGNHELVYARHMEQEQLQSWLASELGTQSLGYCTIFDLRFARHPDHPPVLCATSKAAQSLTRYAKGGDRQSFRVFAHHGAGFAATPAGKLKRLLDFMAAFDADIYFCGHTHDQIGKRLTRIRGDANCRHILSADRIGVISGAYLKTYAEGMITYGEQRGYAPVPLGAAWVRITPQTRELRAEI